MNYEEHYRLLKELNEKVKELNEYGKILNIYIYGNSCMTLLHDKDFNSDYIDAVVEWNDVEKDNGVDILVKEIIEEQNFGRNWIHPVGVAPMDMSPAFGFVRILEEFEYLNIYCLDKRSFLAYKINLDIIYDKQECLVIKSLMNGVNTDYRTYMKDLLGRYYDIKRFPTNVDAMIGAICNVIAETDENILKW